MKSKFEVIGIAILLILGACPRVFPDLETILRGLLISKAGRDSYNIQIEIYDVSHSDEFAELHQYRENSDFETFSRVLKNMLKGVLRITGEYRIIVPIHAVTKKTTKKGIQFLLVAKNQIAEPGVQKGVKRDRFLAIVLDLDKNLSGEGRIYEDAEVKFAEQDIEIRSSSSIPRIIMNIESVNQHPESGTKAIPPSQAVRHMTTVQDRLVRDALTDMDSMNYETAAKKLEKIIAMEPTQKGLKNKLAYAYYRLGKYEKAIRVLSDEIEAYPDDLQAYILLSFLQYKEGNLDEAEKIAIAFHGRLQKYRIDKENSPEAVQDFLKRNAPNVGIPAYILGLRSRMKANYQSAMEWFLRARELGYEKTDCWIQCAIIELQRENWLEILRLCQCKGDISVLNITDIGKADIEVNVQFVQMKKDDPAIPAEIWLSEGIALEQLGRTAEALIAFETAEDRKPYDPDIVKRLAVRYLFDHKSERAISLLRRLVSLYPQDGQAQYLLNQALITSRSNNIISRHTFSDGFFEERDVRYRYVFINEPKKVAEESNLYALQLVKEGKFEAATGWLNSFAEIYEFSPTIHYNLAQLYNFLGRNVEALRYAFKTIEQKRDYKEAYDLAANVFFRVSDFDAAVRFYAKALRQDTNDPLSYYNLGCAFMGRLNYEDAERNWRDAVRLDKTSQPVKRRNVSNFDVLKLEVNVQAELVSAMACRSLGYLYIAQGKTSEAVEAFQKAIISNPSNPLPYFEIGKLLYDHKDFNKADFYFNKYISLGGEEAKVRALKKSRIIGQPDSGRTSISENDNYAASGGRQEAPALSPIQFWNEGKAFFHPNNPTHTVHPCLKNFNIVWVRQIASHSQLTYSKLFAGMFGSLVYILGSYAGQAPLTNLSQFQSLSCITD
jgi:tetratricopeptide (TPR) repeat protein